MIQLMTESPLHQLTPGQRRVLRALHRTGWLYNEAAEDLEMPEESVRTAVFRAVRRSGVRSLAELAYWLGREDERRP